jgi:hypothetical protein
MSMADIMDDIAEAGLTVSGMKRAYAWPTKALEPPCVVVGFPKTLALGVTFGGAHDDVTYPVWFLPGGDDKAARDVISDLLDDGVVAAIEDAFSGSAVVTGASIDGITVSGLEYPALRLDLEVST